MSQSDPSGKRHFLVHCDLSDAPGRMESWDEFVQYYGNNRWALLLEGSDFDGMKQTKPVRERMSTKRLIEWVLERDAEDREQEALSQESEPEEPEQPCEEESPREFGPRTSALYEVAKDEGAAYCAMCLDAWLIGTWPRRSEVRVLDVSAIARRGIWFGVVHLGYAVRTNRGPAFMYPPKADRTAGLVLEGGGSFSGTQPVKISRAVMKKVGDLEPEFAAAVERTRSEREAREKVRGRAS